MRNLLKLKVTEKDRGKYLKDYLKGQGLSARILKRLSREKQIYNGRRPIRLDAVLKGNEVLLINLDREESQDIEPVKMDLNIVFEDDSLIVVDKPPFMVVHPTKSHQMDTMANGLLWHFKEKGEQSIVRLVSRLDMNTSGLVISAKNQFTHSFFAKEMSQNKVKKIYKGIAEGIFIEKEGEFDYPIIKEPAENYKRSVGEGGQPSLTLYKVLEEKEGYSYIEYRLMTGRTHQIRVHTSEAGHPLVNDELYGGKAIIPEPRHFLHASQLIFTHPMTGKEINLKSVIPEDMKYFWESL